MLKSNIFNKRRFLLFLTLTGFLTLLYRFSTLYHSDLEDEIDLGLLLLTAIKSAENGGVNVKNVKDSIAIKLKGLTNEGAEDKVTTADYLSHCAMLKTIQNFFPKVTIISEESNVDCDNKGLIDYELPLIFSNEDYKTLVPLEDITIWIDPLDATQEYTEKLYEYVTTMVCVSIKGKPIIGVIHSPFEKKTTWTWVGKYKSPNLHHELEKREKLKLLISRSHAGKIRHSLQKLKDNIEIVEAGGAGYKSLQVANGKADAYVHITAIKKWDICAGNAVLESLGGIMTTLTNESIDYSKISKYKNEKGLVATFEKSIHDMFLKNL